MIVGFLMIAFKKFCNQIAAFKPMAGTNIQTRNLRSEKENNDIHGCINNRHADIKKPWDKARYSCITVCSQYLLYTPSDTLPLESQNPGVGKFERHPLHHNCHCLLWLSMHFVSFFFIVLLFKFSCEAWGQEVRVVLGILTEIQHKSDRMSSVKQEALLAKTLE